MATVLDWAIKAWNRVLNSGIVDASATEPVIAGYLGHAMLEEKRARGLRGPRIEEEVGTRSAGATKPDGRIDIKIIYNLEESDYFGIECKRVSSRLKALSTKYVQEGVKRFVSGKYSLGHEWAAMFGFVMDGDAPTCMELIRDIMIASKEDLAMQGDFLQSQDFDGIEHLYCSSHLQSSQKLHLQLLHLFLPISKETADPETGPSA